MRIWKKFIKINFSSYTSIVIVFFRFLILSASLRCLVLQYLNHRQSIKPLIRETNLKSAELRIRVLKLS